MIWEFSCCSRDDNTNHPVPRKFLSKSILADFSASLDSGPSSPSRGRSPKRPLMIQEPQQLFGRELSSIPTVPYQSPNSLAKNTLVSLRNLRKSLAADLSSLTPEVVFELHKELMLTSQILEGHDLPGKPSP